MTKKEMAKSIAERLELSSSEVLLVIQMVFDAVTDTLVEDGRIELRRFGVFQVRRRRARRSRNPRTGEPVLVPSKPVVTFKPGLEMAQQVGRMNPT